MQTGHTIATVSMNAPLIVSGTEKSVKYNIGDDYVFRAKQSGVVKEIDKKNELVILEYADGTQAAIDLSVKTGRVSDGYFVTIQLNHELEVGQKFKANDILATDKQFFNEVSNDAALTMGTLARVAITCQDQTYEDSSTISRKLAEKLTSKVTFEKIVALSSSVNIISIKNEGDTVKTSDNFVVYEEIMDDESGSLNKIFDKISDEFKSIAEDYNYSKVPSKYTGNIIALKIYYNRELSELSTSLQEIILKYQKKYSNKAKKLSNMRRDHIIYVPQIEKVEFGKRVAGTEFDGVLLQYFIQTNDNFKVGENLSPFTK